MIDTKQIITPSSLNTNEKGEQDSVQTTAPRSALAHALKTLAQKRPTRTPQPPSVAANPVIIHHTAAPSVQPPRQDRRAFPRRISRCTVSLCADTGGGEDSLFKRAWTLHSSQIKGRMVDISRSGLSMTLGRSLELGQSICMKIENPLFNHRLIAVAEVVRQQPDGWGNWTVMCRFARPLEFEQIEFFGCHLFTARVV
ncbi:PilZ domain protein [Symmachiella macrocystis]|uniref:PilZ domain protein n=1 Tax=Symmachiella macrocystis TaxID=2527985 RepID=A0A5C6BQI5_9PLAN|nr:PilZ domain-containing protein [Symmachiella macrocystis]TWU13651.1 PilZ domain protein [Symmachiella macrocystis]